jgi:hypothetical protein
MPAAAPATLVKPNTAAMIATTKKVSAHDSIGKDLLKTAQAMRSTHRSLSTQAGNART